MFTLIGSNRDDLQSSYLDPTPSQDTGEVLFRFFKSAAASDNNDGFLAEFVANDDAYSIESDATTVDTATNLAEES